MKKYNYYMDNLPFMERRFIDAERPISKLETEEQYLALEQRFRIFLVLKEYEEDLLCFQMGYTKDDNSIKFAKCDYPGLKYDSTPVTSLVFIDKDSVREVYDSFVKENEFFEVVNFINPHSFSIFNELELKRVKDFYEEYYSSKIMKGSVIAVNGKFKGLYFVKNVLIDGCLELLPLSYNPKSGLDIKSFDSIFVPYNSFVLYSYVYFEEYSNRIQRMIDEKILKLK